MSLAQFLAVIRRRHWLLTMLTLLGVTGGVTLSLLATPLYRAEAQMFVSVDGGSTASDLSQGGSFSESRVASYAKLSTSTAILRAAAREAGVEAAPSELERAVRTTTNADTVIMSIAATQPDPEKAAALADAIAAQTIELVGDLEKTDALGESLVKLSVYQKAEVPTAPASPRVPVDIAVGALIGLALGIGSALLRETMDTKVRSVDQVASASGKSVLAEIPVSDDIATIALTSSGGQFSSTAEAYRQLRTHLTFTNLDGDCQVIVVTSSLAGEGKSTTASNLALMLAQNGHRTLLVDADLRRPSVADILGIEGSVGLSTVLAHQVELDDAIQVVGEGGLRVLTSGQVPPNPSELLSSRQMQLVVQTASVSFDYVIIDAPPALPVTDPAVLGASASGVLFVASVDGRVKMGDIGRAVSKVDAVGARVLGVVANRVRVGHRPESYSYYATARPQSESPRRARRAAVEGRR
ncbi:MULTISPECIES: polysaccharide biosynthesis tyrosine autokinase [unclassified Curtobacterium]|uniref:polysaccharide biosynthesis tyrosine autokinase n=1 Tax=unclassified Curtobacterium TaxID=257496 RepID=UPI000D97376D|nr:MULTISPECIES: polysaccharide biosynthesis tyrosine autokinase [unclassified Curtobacterium]PYY33959.1 chromosome partitioning protein [Curtobacterium sp. MCBD17_030]PZE35699.1 chromosome partitioning protein [Curtobacterium sp. MCPF17_031]